MHRNALKFPDSLTCYSMLVNPLCNYFFLSYFWIYLFLHVTFKILLYHFSKVFTLFSLLDNLLYNKCFEFPVSVISRFHQGVFWSFISLGAIYLISSFSLSIYVILCLLDKWTTDLSLVRLAPCQRLLSLLNWSRGNMSF